MSVPNCNQFDYQILLTTKKIQSNEKQITTLKLKTYHLLVPFLFSKKNQSKTQNVRQKRSIKMFEKKRVKKLISDISAIFLAECLEISINPFHGQWGCSSVVERSLRM